VGAVGSLQTASQRFRVSGLGEQTRLAPPLLTHVPSAFSAAAAAALSASNRDLASASILAMLFVREASSALSFSALTRSSCSSACGNGENREGVSGSQPQLAGCLLLAPLPPLSILTLTLRHRRFVGRRLVVHQHHPRVVFHPDSTVLAVMVVAPPRGGGKLVDLL